MTTEDSSEAYTAVQFHPDGLILGTGERLPADAHEAGGPPTLWGGGLKGPCVSLSGEDMIDICVDIYIRDGRDQSSMTVSVGRPYLMAAVGPASSRLLIPSCPPPPADSHGQVLHPHLGGQAAEERRDV